LKPLFGVSAKDDAAGHGMNAPNTLTHQGHRLLQIGMALFLFTSFEGFAIPYFAAPLLGRSAHSLSALLGVILIALGLSWPRLHLSKAASRIAFWFLIYSGFAITAAFLIAGIWGAGEFTMPLAGAPPWELHFRSPSLPPSPTRPHRPGLSHSRLSCGVCASKSAGQSPP
jgi:hydroxylaminobenzene mutase